MLLLPPPTRPGWRASHKVEARHDDESNKSPFVLNCTPPPTHSDLNRSAAINRDYDERSCMRQAAARGNLWPRSFISQIKTQFCAIKRESMKNCAKMLLRSTSWASLFPSLPPIFLLTVEAFKSKQFRRTLNNYISQGTARTPSPPPSSPQKICPVHHEHEILIQGEERPSCATICISLHWVALLGAVDGGHKNPFKTL